MGVTKSEQETTPGCQTQGSLRAAEEQTGHNYETIAA
jgi:hypothetical protein